MYSTLSKAVAISFVTKQGSMKMLKFYVADIGINEVLVKSGTNISLLIVTTYSPIREKSPV